MHLDKPYNGTTDIWFSSSGKINGTGTKNWISKSNIKEDTETVVLTDNLILSNLIKDVLNAPVIAFSSISNSYQILKVLDNTNIQNIIFTVRVSDNQNLDYIIHRVFKDLIPLGYNLESKFVGSYKDILADDFLDTYKLEKVA
jgi:DNA polymerase III alpha subunit (gram-positive type)